MKGKDCCGRCKYLMILSKQDYGLCRKFPKCEMKYRKDWCGEFENNNKHIMEDDDEG